MDSESFNQETQPMICDVLHRLNKAGDLTVKEIEDLFNLADRSAYAYFGKTEISLSQFRTLVRHCRSRRAKKQLLEFIVADMPVIFEMLDASSDVNGDGVVDTNDVLDAGIKATSDAMSLLKLVRKSGSTRSISRIRGDDLNRSINDAIHALVAARSAVSIICQRT